MVNTSYRRVFPSESLIGFLFFLLSLNTHTGLWRIGPFPLWCRVFGTQKTHTQVRCRSAEVLCHPASFWRELGWRQFSRNTEPLIIGGGGGHTASHRRLDGQVVREDKEQTLQWFFWNWQGEQSRTWWLGNDEKEANRDSREIKRVWGI